MTTVTLQEPLTVPVKQGVSSSSRLSSIDAYRGFVMFLMMAEVLKFHRIATARPANVFWRFLSYHQTHVPWIGCSLHDLIQPSFSFLVGVALPFSLANRMARGQSKSNMTAHALWRSIILILLGVFLRSTHATQTNWTFDDTLTQIGFGYFWLFLIGFRSVRFQWITLGIILVGYWIAFASYPLPGSNFDYSSVGVAKDSPAILSGFSAHWSKNSNLAWAFDTWFMNLFPRPTPFKFSSGGYATLSFIPTLGTMILGLIAGGVLRSARTSTEKIKWLVSAGVLSLAMGAGFGWSGICPVVKRIWTPSWTVFSGGWCFLLMAGFYWLIDIKGKSRWVFPLVIIGMNSIAAYCIAHLFDAFIAQALVTHLGNSIFDVFGTAYHTLLLGIAVLLIYWLLLFWMYRRKIFLRV